MDNSDESITIKLSRLSRVLRLSGDEEHSRLIDKAIDEIIEYKGKSSETKELVDKLSKSVHQANAQAEWFERWWYLRGNLMEDTESHLASFFEVYDKRDQENPVTWSSKLDIAVNHLRHEHTAIKANLEYGQNYK